MQCSDAILNAMVMQSPTWARCSQRWPNVWWLVTTSFRLALFHANCSLFRLALFHANCSLFRLALFHANCLCIWSAHNMSEVHAIISFHLILSHLLMFTIMVWTIYLKIPSYHQSYKVPQLLIYSMNHTTINTSYELSLHIKTSYVNPMR